MSGFYVIAREPLTEGTVPSVLLEGLTRARTEAEWWSHRQRTRRRVMSRGHAPAEATP